MYFYIFVCVRSAVLINRSAFVYHYFRHYYYCYYGRFSIVKTSTNLDQRFVSSLLIITATAFYEFNAISKIRRQLRVLIQVGNNKAIIKESIETLCWVTHGGGNKIKKVMQLRQ